MLGASSYTYAEATLTEQLPDWIGAHVRALNFFGGVPELLVPDNTKTAVAKACRYDPDLNPVYSDMAQFYGMGIVPARAYKPRDGQGGSRSSVGGALDTGRPPAPNADVDRGNQRRHL